VQGLTHQLGHQALQAGLATALGTDHHRGPLLRDAHQQVLQRAQQAVEHLQLPGGGHRGLRTRRPAVPNLHDIAGDVHCGRWDGVPEVRLVRAGL